MNCSPAHTLPAELLSSFPLQNHSCNALLLFLPRPPFFFFQFFSHFHVGVQVAWG